MKIDLNEEILKKLNHADFLPPKSFYRNYIYYGLVANTNCLLGAVLSENIEAVKILCVRERQYIDELRENFNHPYLDLCEDFLSQVASLLNFYP